MSAFKLILFFLLFYNSLNFNHEFPLHVADDTILMQVLNGIINIVMELAASKEYYFSNITRECQSLLDRTFFLMNKTDIEEEEINLAYYYYSKIIFDSSTNVNDLSSYSNCMERDHQYDFSNSTRKPLKPTYITLFVDFRKDLLKNFREGNRTTSYLVGICFVENCSEDDQKFLLKTVLKYLKLLPQGQDLEVYELKEQDYHPNFFINFLKFIPLHIIFLHLFIILFHKYIAYLYKKIQETCCYRHKPIKIIPRITHKLDDTELSPNDSFSKSTIKRSKTKHNQNFQNYVKALFNIDNNFNFLNTSNEKNEIHNNSSLSYMNGIKGISMITILFGFVFIDLYNTPSTKQTMDNFYNIMKNPFFFLIYFGIKYGPKLILCASGFSLLFKFMCFLDDKFEEEKKLKQAKEEEMNNENNNNTITDNINNTLEDKNNENKSRSNSYYSASVYSNRNREKLNISFKYYFLFIGTQIHKYILYLLILFFILFSLFDFALLFIDLGPMWNLFKKKMIEPSLKVLSLLPSLFCFQGYFLNDLEKDSILNYFYIVYQEVIYFIISTLIIFLGYKYHLRIDRFIIITIILSWILRIIYYNIDGDLNAKEYFTFHGYALFYNSIIYNYLYYALGLYFGSLNYVIQKRYTYYECDKQQKTYLLGFTRLLKIIKKKSKLLFYSLGIFFLILIIIFSFIQSILFKYVTVANDIDDSEFKDYNRNSTIPKILKAYNDDSFVGLVMFLDTDIVVILVNLMALFFYLKGESYVYNFLNLNFWGIFNKIYFSFIILINPVILYVLYITESRITFNLQNCYLYSFASGILLFTLTIFIYALLELPYRKAIKLYLKRYDIKATEKALDNIDNSIVKQMEFKGDMIKRDDSVYDKENEEEENFDDNNEIKLEEKFVDKDNEKEE